MGVTILGGYPTLAQQNGILYLSAWASGVQTIRRSQDMFATLLGASAQITAGADQGHAGLCKMRSSGHPLVAVVPKAGQLVTLISRDDGLNWSQVS